MCRRSIKGQVLLAGGSLKARMLFALPNEEYTICAFQSSASVCTELRRAGAVKSNL
jgi:hypothetical protein